MEFNTSSMDLTNSDSQHVFPTTDNKPDRPGLRNFLFTLLGVFIAMLACSVVMASTDSWTPTLIVFGATAILLPILFIALSKANRKKSITHIIVDERGVTFLKRNGEKTFYTLSQFINLKVTRHYYNGAYTGSSHSLLFTNAKGKQDEIQLGGMDKDLISSMFDDINCMKKFGKFYKPEVNPAVKTVPVSDAGNSNVAGAAPIVGDDATTVKTEVDPNFPYGVSPIDGRIYTHDADKAIAARKATAKTCKLIILAETLALIICVLGAVIFSKGKDFNVPFAAGAAGFGFALMISTIALAAVFAQAKANTSDLIKQVAFYSNCLVITTTYYNHVIEIPQISKILLTSPNASNPKGARSLKVLKNNSEKLEINMGLINSKRAYEIFGNYANFHADINVWSANHGIVCVNDISL